MPRYQSFSSVLRGTMTGVGNSLGLTGNPSSGSAGAYITTDTTVNAGAGWPNGTTLNSNLALSFGQLNIPGGASTTILYAELFWISDLTSISICEFHTPQTIVTLSPRSETNFNVDSFAFRSQIVTDLVIASRDGMYGVGKVPYNSGGGNLRGSGWGLIVVCQNDSFPIKSITVDMGVSNTGLVTVSNLLTPATGQVTGRLIASASDGDGANTFSVNAGTGLQTVSGPRNDVTKFFNAQVNIINSQDPNVGYTDTSGTMGNANKPYNQSANAPYVRTFLDITNISLNSLLANNVTQIQVSTAASGEVIAVNVFAIEVDSLAAVLDSVKTTNKNFAMLGDEIIYTVSLTNSGILPALNPIFVDTPPQGLTFIPNSVSVDGINRPSATVLSPGVLLNSIPVGGTITISFKVILTNTLPSPYKNSSITYYEFETLVGQPNAKNNSISNIVTTTIVSVPKIQAIKSSDKDVYEERDKIKYTISINNTSSTDAVNALFIDTLPEGLSFVLGSFILDGVTITPVNIETGVSLGTLPKNILKTIEFKANIDNINNSPFTNTAYINYDYFIESTTMPVSDSTISNQITSNISSTTITKLTNKNFTTTDDIITYTILIKNRGSINLNSIIFKDTLPGEVSFIPSSVYLDGVNLPDKNPESNIIIDTILSGITRTINFNVTVTATLPSEIINDGFINYSYFDGFTTIPRSLLSNIVTTTLVKPILDGIHKMVDKSFVECGERITYTIVVPNTGNLTAQNVIFKDTIPNGTVLLPASVYVNGIQQSDATLATGVTIPNIRPGSTATLTFSVQVQC